MDIVNDFKTHLFTEKSKPSKVTVKNYLSDVRKFLQWFQTTHNTPFDPASLSPEVIKNFQSYLQKNSQGSVVAARSAKRYLSSLRKFCRFLRDSGAIEANPFEVIIESPKAPEDPWRIKAFKNALITEDASKLTIKNYLFDIQQFLLWFEKVTEGDESGKAHGFHRLNNDAILHYKERLLHDSKFSATSINRKLSSLRRYINWLRAQGYVEPLAVVHEAPVQVEEPQTEATPIIQPAIPLTALHQIAEAESIVRETIYSSFAPFRLAQKTQKIITYGFDLLIFNPIAEGVEAVQYTIWKTSGKKVFTPVKTILEDAGQKLPDPIIKTIKPKEISTINRLTTQAVVVVENLMRVKTVAKPYTIRNISKSFYAPLAISLTHLPWHQRLLHHLRHTRPAWYKKYHSYPISHHIHFAVLMFAMATAAAATYHVATENPRPNASALASQPMAPPRTLSFQGRLMDKTNTPITAETTLRFAIYNSPHASGSAMLWQETQPVTPNQDGFFSTALGKKATLSQELLTSTPNIYVGIAVGNDTELKPRREIATTGLSANSQSLQGLKPITSSGETQNVVLALDSSGDLTIGGSASPTFQATGGQFTLSGQTLLLTTNPGSNGNIALTPDGSGIIDMQAPLQNTTNNNSLSGIPGAVEVADLLAIVTASASQSAFTVKQNSSGDIISGYSNEIAKFRVDSSGNGMFAGNLAINGNTIATNANTFGIANTNVVNLSIGNNASALSLGGRSGITTINNSLEVQGNTTLNGSVSVKGLLTANEGLSVPADKSFTLSGFNPGAIPFIGSNAQVVQDTSLSWEQTAKSFKVVGAVCVKATAGACAGSTAGTIYAANATVQAADLAENYISSQQLEPGDVVIPEGLGNSLAIVKSTAAYQPQIIGIVSTKPGFTLNSDAQTDAQHPNIYPLALQGRVPVKVTTSNGAIKTGDPLTSSSIPGVAMKATKPGQIIAKALESYDAEPNTIGKVMAFVNVSHQGSEATFTDAGDLTLAVNSGIKTSSEEGKTLEDTTTLAYANSIINSIKSNLIEATEISTQKLTIATNNIFVNGQHLDDYISGIVAKATGNHIANTSLPSADALDGMTINASGSADIEIEPKASIAAVAVNAASQSATASIAAQPIASPAAIILPLYNSSASAGLTPIASATPTLELNRTGSSAAQLQSDMSNFLNNDTTNFMDTLKTPTELGLEKLDTKEATVSQTLSVLGRTTLSDVGITGKINIGLMSIDGLDAEGFASINTSNGPLKLQSNGFNGVDFLNGKVAIDTQGNLKVNGNAFFAKDVTVKGKLAANIIAPIPGSDLTVQNTQGREVVKVNQKGDVEASGAGKFAGINIVRGAQADTSVTETKANSSAGKGAIKAHQKERTIYTPYVTKQSLIYVTATSDTQRMTPYVARQTAQEDGRGSFTIQIPNSVSKDINFNWWIVN